MPNLMRNLKRAKMIAAADLGHHLRPFQWLDLSRTGAEATCFECGVRVIVQLNGGTQPLITGISQLGGVCSPTAMERLAQYRLREEETLRQLGVRGHVMSTPEPINRNPVVRETRCKGCKYRATISYEGAALSAGLEDECRSPVPDEHAARTVVATETVETETSPQPTSIPVAVVASALLPADMCPKCRSPLGTMGLLKPHGSDINHVFSRAWQRVECSNPKCDYVGKFWYNLSFEKLEQWLD